MGRPKGPKKVHRYTVEFKIQAVRLSLHPEIQMQDVAHALDIHPFMLSKWKKDYRECRLKPVSAGLTSPELKSFKNANPLFTRQIGILYYTYSYSPLDNQSIVTTTLPRVCPPSTCSCALTMSARG